MRMLGNEKNRRGLDEALNDYDDEKRRRDAAERLRDCKPMNEAETVAFMGKKGFRPMEEWTPGRPLLYVFPEYVREQRDVHHSSIARINNPRELDLKKPETDINTGERVYVIGTVGLIDLYAIDRKTEKPVYVSSTSRRWYVIRKEMLFIADDNLFPSREKKRSR